MSRLRCIGLAAVLVASGAWPAAATAATRDLVASEAVAESAPSRTDAVVRGLAALPAGVDRYAVLPGLSHTAGTIDQWLAGMNRAGMLLGADPVDQLMGVLGFSRHVDRFGAVVVGIQGEGAAARTVVLMPSRDPEGFLLTNFRPGEAPGAYIDAGGDAVFARVVDGHVAMASGAWVLEYVPAGADAAAARAAAWPPAVTRMVRDADLVAVAGGIDPAGPFPRLDGFLAAARAAIESAGLPAPGLAIARTVLDALAGAVAVDGGLGTDARLAAIAVRFDPLGLLVDGHVAWRPGLAGTAPTAARPAPRALAGVDGPPFFAGAGWDRRDSEATGSLERLAAAVDLRLGPAAGAGAETITLELPRHTGPLAEGLFGPATATLDGVDPRALNGPEPIAALAGWRIDATGEGDGSRAWRLRRGGGAGGSPGGTLLAIAAGGPAGLRGTITKVGQATVLAGAGAGAAAPTGGAGASRLEDDPAVGLMRSMRGFEGHTEAYIDVAAISRWLATAARDLPMLGSIEAIEGELPPLGLGARADAAGVDVSVIVPAPIMVQLYDAAAARALASLARSTGAPAAGDSDGGAP